jgi:hypothetical protein
MTHFTFAYATTESFPDAAPRLKRRPASFHERSARDEPVEPLAARMLNEVVYCPRLFYYEHVEGVFVQNADTRRGAALHKRVDAGKGALPAPGKVEGPTPTKTEEPDDHRVAASRPR